MADIYPTTKIAAVQAAPVFLDRDETIKKVRRLTKEAKNNGADLVVFPESFIPTFPVWCQILNPMDQHAFFTRLYQNAVMIPSPAFNELQKIARDNSIFLSIGVTEKGENSMGAMWNTNLIFDRSGNLIARHRKLQPTWAEKLIWSFGDGSSLNVHDTEIGRLGCLICGENTNTIARYAIAAQMEQIHISTYPPCSPTNRFSKGDYPNTLRVRACAHSFEAKVFTVASCSVLDQQALEEITAVDSTLVNWLEDQSWATTMIAAPNGQICSDIIGDNQEGIVYAECDINREIALKNLHDVTGSYQRFDIFQLNVDKTVREPIFVSKQNDLPDRDFYPFVEDTPEINE
ncbi:MAG: carbon-nitrogen hydrolase family protein [Oscillospiraceae bacterium]